MLGEFLLCRFTVGELRFQRLTLSDEIKGSVVYRALTFTRFGDFALDLLLDKYVERNIAGV